jgi:hypothetical protein
VPREGQARPAARRGVSPPFPRPPASRSHACRGRNRPA